MRRSFFADFCKNGSLKMVLFILNDKSVDWNPRLAVIEAKSLAKFVIQRGRQPVCVEFFWEKIFLEKVFYYRHHARKFQRDQIGFFATNFLTKVAQIFGNF